MRDRLGTRPEPDGERRTARIGRSLPDAAARNRPESTQADVRRDRLTGQRNGGMRKLAPSTASSGLVKCQASSDLAFTVIATGGLKLLCFGTLTSVEACRINQMVVQDNKRV